MEDGSAPNIQNEFFNQVRKEKTRVALFLNSGKRLTGRIKSFDKFTLLLETSQGEQIIFKHAVATVGPQVGPPPRSRESFNNRMSIRPGGRPSGGPGEPASGNDPESGAV